MPYVFSTLPNSMVFTSHLPKKPNLSEKPRLEQRIIENAVVIQGGSGMVPFGDNEVKVGCRTTVSEEQLGFLLANDGFQKMVIDGFMAYHNEKKYSAEKMAKKGMDLNDKSIQKSPKDLKVEEKGKFGEKVYEAKEDV